MNLNNQILNNNPITSTSNSKPSHSVKIFKEILNKTMKDKSIEHRFRREATKNRPTGTNCIDIFGKKTCTPVKPSTTTVNPLTTTDDRPKGTKYIRKYDQDTTRPC